MKHSLPGLRSLPLSMLVVASFAIGNAHAASYFVQPIIQVSPGGVINGLEINGSLQRSEGFNNAPTSINSIIDLSAGTIKGNVALTGGTPSAAFSQGRLGERVRFDGGVGTIATFTFDVNGTINADARDPNLNSTQQVFVEAYIAVFAASTGATSSTWFDLSFGAEDQTLAKDRVTFSFTNPSVDISEMISETLQASVMIEAGQRSFDVFANLTLIGSLNLNPGTVNLDFLNTASLGIQVDPGVTYASASGAFLDSTTVIPLPAAVWFSLSALGSLLLVRRRQVISKA